VNEKEKIGRKPCIWVMTASGMQDPPPPPPGFLSQHYCLLLPGGLYLGGITKIPIQKLSVSIGVRQTFRMSNYWPWLGVGIDANSTVMDIPSFGYSVW